MRSAHHRKEKYKKKIRGLVIPGQGSRYSMTVRDRMKLEQIVKSLGVTPILAFSYLAYAEQLLKIKKKHQRQIAANEALVTATHWLNRGLSPTFLNDISEALGLGRVIPPGPPPPTLHEYYNVGEESDFHIYGTRWVAQTFTVGTVGPNENHIITSVKVKIYRPGPVTPGDLHADIYAADGAGKPTGPILSHGTMDGNTIVQFPPGLWYEISMSAYTLQAGTQYALVLKVPTGDSANRITWRFDSEGTYAGGTIVFSGDAGGSWTICALWDAMFEIWGSSV